MLRSYLLSLCLCVSVVQVVCPWIKWLFAFRQLRQRGVLGINRRNAACILDRNPRSRFPIVDDKLLMAELCTRIGVSSPAIFGVISQHGELRLLDCLLHGHGEFVMKPAAVRAVAALSSSPAETANRFARRMAGRSILTVCRAHGSDILGPILTGWPARSRPLPTANSAASRFLVHFAVAAWPTPRIILYRFEPAMATLRLPTLASNGLRQPAPGRHRRRGRPGLRANAPRDFSRSFHQSPSGYGRNNNRPVHPAWDAIVEMARKTARAVGLGFVGIDIVLDEHDGPLLLEANARPGLTIQLANDQGLQEAIEEIDRLARS